MTLPANLYISKDPKPKGWSYPLKSTEIADGLEIAALPLPFHLYYDNMMDHDKSYSIFTMAYYGHFNNHDQDPYFFMQVRAIKSKLRHFLNGFLKDEVFSVVRTWMVTCQKDERYKNKVVHLRVTYHDFEFTNKKKLWIYERFGSDYKTRDLYEKEIDLEAEAAKCLKSQT